MKIILSRKGFDSGSGGYPSPILPDGTLLSLPIPDQNDVNKYSDLKVDHQTSYYDIMKQLIKRELKCGKDKIKLDNDTTCHLDPDLNESIIVRPNGFKPLFGQMDAAQSHLSNHHVEVGDLFLFFGWFRQTIIENNQLKFDPKDKEGRHIIFGYMQIGEIIKTASLKKLVPLWLMNHPHYLDEKRRTSNKNAIYVGSDTLSWNKQLKGADTFNYDDCLVLTKSECKRSQWQLPDCFKSVKMTFHKESSWKEDHFKCVDRGQEFVVEEDEEVMQWVKDLIEKMNKK